MKPNQLLARRAQDLAQIHKAKGSGSLDGYLGDVEHFGYLFDRQSLKKTKFDDISLASIDFAQFLKRLNTGKFVVNQVLSAGVIRCFDNDLKLAFGMLAPV